MNFLINKSSKKTLTTSQSTFNRLIKKIEKIQREITETEAILDQGLRYYHTHVRSAEEKMVEKLSECICIFYSYYRYPGTKLSKKQCEILKELIHSLLIHLSQYVMPQDLNKEITDIITDIEGVDFKEAVNSEIESLKKDIASYAEQEGLNIDLSSINFTDPKEELMAKLQNAIFEAKEKKIIEETDTKDNVKEEIQKKTKQQLMKEQRAREIKEIQRKGLSKIYKQLAKTLHPDLELDPIAKAEKETLMKKLTVAYENQDLHTLFSLEITCMNRTASSESDSPETQEQLKVYNSILKDQVESLQEQLDNLFMHPRYFDIQHILSRYPPFSFLEILKNKEQQLSKDVEHYSLTITDLKEGSNFKKVKEILKEFSKELDVFEMFESFL
jgi:hypothetical protein